MSKQYAPYLICCMKACKRVLNVVCVKQILRMIAVSLRSLGPSAMFYLAAAVSDFYVPWESMVIIYSFLALFWLNLQLEMVGCSLIFVLFFFVVS